jgi:hypothetical protein
MYIVVIGYAYVIFMMALAVIMAGAWLKGLAIAIFLGVLPLWVMIKATPRHRRHARRDQAADAPDGNQAEDPRQHPL